MQGRIKLFIADDHQMFIDGIKALLQNTENIVIIGKATNGKQLIEKLKELSPDIILMDIGMPDLNGIDATKMISKEYPTIKIIALTMYDDNNRVVKMLKAGAKGYVLKNTTREELLHAIQTVAVGGVHYSAQAVVNTMQNISDKNSNPVANLTEREIEIIRLIVKEMTNKEIADKLFISELTVNTHRKNAMRKLEIKNTAGLVKFAIDHHLIDN
ncbi:MAG TPA: response regulator transcription factor [Bacteroidia bacterium]|nr:response regulator transcription factor [Bacteroidia bacterium]